MNNDASQKKDFESPESVYQSLAMEVSTYLNEQDVQVLRDAFEFGAKAHEGQIRKSGEPYITHPLEVARIGASLKLDRSSLVAAVLHDTVEDTDCSLEAIGQRFGEEVSALVDGLTKIGKIKFQSSQERLAENFRKMILAMAKDLRVILVKLCDRLHNMRTIGPLAIDKKKRISQETLDIYAPLANRLGIYGIKSELEDLCLRVLKQDIYQDFGKRSIVLSINPAFVTRSLLN